MKFFHLSDLHIGKQLYHYNMSVEQRDILAQIVELVKKEKPDAVLIAGDIYDAAVPSAEAVSIFDEFLTGLTEAAPQMPILLIAGNHDSARRIDFASAILARHKVYIAGMPPVEPKEKIKRVTLQDAYGEVDFYLLPFLKPSYVRKLFDEEITGYDMAVRKVLARETIDESRRNVLLSHQFYTASGEMPLTNDAKTAVAGGIENVDISVLAPFDYAALGHIHRPQKMGKENYRYCGTPLAYSVGEMAEKSVTVVELLKKGDAPRITTLPLTPLRQVRKLTGPIAEILAWQEEGVCHDFVSITLTDDVEIQRPKERLEEKFDHILEIRVDNDRTRKILEFPEAKLEILNPYEAFCNFFSEMNGRMLTEEEKKELLDVIDKAKEDKQQ